MAYVGGWVCVDERGERERDEGLRERELLSMCVCVYVCTYLEAM
jgi:hypothetical protein